MHQACHLWLRKNISKVVQEIVTITADKQICQVLLRPIKATGLMRASITLSRVKELMTLIQARISITEKKRKMMINFQELERKFKEKTSI